MKFKRQIGRALTALTLYICSMSSQVLAQNGQEQWLRYSNWESRSSRRPRAAQTSASSEEVKKDSPQSTQSSVSPLSSQSPFANSLYSKSPLDQYSATPLDQYSHSPYLQPQFATNSGRSSTQSYLSSGDPTVPLPENPGSQTVEGGQFSIPGWAFQQPQPQAQRPIEILPGQIPFGGPSFQSNIAGYSGSMGYGGRGLLGAIFGGGFRGAYYGGWNGGGRWGGMRQSPLGPGVMQIQTGPSPSSGNYYQPSTPDSANSSGYYASGTPWQVPINGPNNPKDYWGPLGSPFK